MRAESGGEAGSFAKQYAPLAKEVFRKIATDALDEGKNPEELARRYADMGKPDFALAFLLASQLPDGAKREVYAHAYQQRASRTEQRARDFDRMYHRPFPLLLTDAANDRGAARKVLAGQALNPGAGRQLPTL